MNRKMEKTSSNLSRILEINKKINSYYDLRDILENILLSARELFNASGGSILLIDNDKNFLSFKVVHGDGKDKLEGLKIPVDKGIAGYIFSTQNPVISNDTANDPRFFSQIDKITGLKTQKIIGVPLVKDGVSIGVIEIVNKVDNSDFTEDELELLRIFAEQAVIAINNAIMLKKIKDRARELEYLYNISNSTISSIQNTQEVFQSIIKTVSEITKAKKISIMTFDEKERILKVVSSVGLEEEIMDSLWVSIDDLKSPAVVSYKEGKHILMENVDIDPIFGPNKSSRYKANSFMIFPIRTHNDIVGVLNITEIPDGLGKVEKEDIELLQLIANQIGYVYESIRTYQREIEKKALDRELEVMRKIQMEMLPSNFDFGTKLDVYFYVEPYKVIGGDFYDVFYVSDGKLCFFLGDVSGKGLHASIFMAAVKSTLKALSFEFKEPKRVLEASNSIVFQYSETSMFSTLFFGLIDIEKMTLKFSNAGHGQQLLIRNGDVIPLYNKGLPLCIYDNVTYEQSEIPILKGDLIVVYSDGITESVNSNEDMFGENRIIDIVSKNYHLSSYGISQILLTTLKNFKVENPNYDDDISLGIIKIL
ncbi:MAG: SpoIIE family protein phosphatase [Spirochaetia bacterium]|nr:SpoIIE family protein phosphatase [Spirochaetota bacterium]MCX8096025.1 SpoIIE family protein phosphatase [Spirochaetota bacterium]MDW8111820.1 SpoIIE family protein phosphatase [Spirochaetia bacterium]